jgi:CubicO group peptidase (beta-lactamase class C family)
MLAGGHTGFTGTTLVVDRASDTFMVMLGHRVYPIFPLCGLQSHSLSR